jgi:hypothetical protein
MQILQNIPWILVVLATVGFAYIVNSMKKLPPVNSATLFFGAIGLAVATLMYFVRTNDVGLILSYVALIPYLYFQMLMLM